MADALGTPAALPPAPQPEGDARRAVRHRGSHVQITACAGSGKTEVVAQRVADLFGAASTPQAWWHSRSEERTIARLAAAPVELCVVADDDQSIYQWRGSDVGNIVTFRARYPAVTTFDVTRNRRSRPDIIEHANRFARTIAGRLPKEMLAHRELAGPEVVMWRAATEADEANTIATTIQAMRAHGYRYRNAWSGRTSPCT
ncbi:MAG: UvrD-helicase domain-containing protein, partial [Actinobacteria bacterium]|nr:UvrD-helicase domain-containing protein [Actinomycetota bacterium]